MTRSTPAPPSAAELATRFETCLQVFSRSHAETPTTGPVITERFNELLAAIETYPPEHRVEILAAIASALTAAVDFLRCTEEVAR